MKFSPAVGAALLAGIAQASPAPAFTQMAPPTKQAAPAAFDIAKTFTEHTLFQGIAAPAAGSTPAISLGLHLPQASIQGSVHVAVSQTFLTEQTLVVSLGGLKAYVEVALAASASVSEAVELAASEQLSIAVPGLLEVDIGAAFALDLIIGVSAAVEVNAGFYIEFPANASVEISLLTKEIVKHSL
jgi:hypothetical protein